MTFRSVNLTDARNLLDRSRIMDKTTTISVRTRIDKAMAKSNSQYAIAGALVRPYGGERFDAWLTATNGHLLACVPVNAKGDLSPADQMPASLVPTVKSGGTITRNGMWLNDRGRYVETDDNPGAFPPTRDVVPEMSDSGYYAISLNAKLLLDLAQALGGDSVTLIVCPDKDAEKDAPHHRKPIRVLPGGENADNKSFGVLMPRSTTRDVAKDWAERTKQYRKDHA